VKSPEPRTISAVRMRSVVLMFVMPLIALVGCDDMAKGFGYVPAKPDTRPRAKQERLSPTHRFILTRYGANVALDTETGQLCRTWDWQPTGKGVKTDPFTGANPERMFGEFTPTCLLLYQQYPTMGSSNDAVAITEEQGN
jgi:hypothetical protein